MPPYKTRDLREIYRPDDSYYSLECEYARCSKCFYFLKDFIADGKSQRHYSLALRPEATSRAFQEDICIFAN